MKLALDNATIVTWLSISAPIVRLLAVTDSLALDATDDDGGLQLCGLNFLRPTLNHPSTVL
ncbi:MAG: hypothetical protein HZA46_10700 [Planctomycetales bacterium]|nr:hypothetical protein [Planctomycetales bacterium]